MDLAAYMDANDLDDAALGKQIGRSRVAVSRYRRGLETPSSGVVKRIVKISAGAVTANELLGITAPAGADQ